MVERKQPAEVVPNFWVESVETLRSYYIDKLGFGHRMGMLGKDGRLDFCIVERERVLVMMGRPQPGQEAVAVAKGAGRPVEIYAYVADVDAFHAEVTARGVAPVEPLTTQWWGDRNFAVRDPYGYTLWFCQAVGELEPPPGVTVV
jgi:uncharacterized glyoxalase superfamily protein PhnB